MPVHIHGTPCEIDAIAEICKRRGLVLIEDAAQAHGSTHRGKKLGTIGAAGCFSLQSSKSLGAGEGGLIVTDDEALFAAANRARMFGEDVRMSDEASYRIERALDGNRAYDSLGMGWMYRTNELTAAVARVQLRKLDAMNAQAQRNAALLSKRLAMLPGVTPPHIADGDTTCVHKYRVRLDGRAQGVEAAPAKVRDVVRAALVAQGVEAVLWQSQPVPGQKLFRAKAGFAGKGFPWDAAPAVDYDLAQFPETTRLLEARSCCSRTPVRSRHRHCRWSKHMPTRSSTCGAGSASSSARHARDRKSHRGSALDAGPHRRRCMRGDGRRA